MTPTRKYVFCRCIREVFRGSDQITRCKLFILCLRSELKNIAVVFSMRALTSFTADNVSVWIDTFVLIVSYEIYSYKPGNHIKTNNKVTIKNSPSK